MANDFSDQKIIPSTAEELCLFSQREIEALLQSEALPRGAVIRAYDRNAKSDWISKTWVCFLCFPFTIGMKYPFPDLVNRFFKMTGLSYAQTQPMIWRILHSLCMINQTENLGIDIPEIAACYQLGTHGYKRFTLKTRNKEKMMVPRSSHNDGDWNRKFFFVKRSTIPGGLDLPLEWVKKVPKFEDLVIPVSLDSPKLVRLFDIPNREKLSATVTAPSQASTSSTTPVMSSAPKPTAKFSLADLKTSMVKKEKGSETPASKPAQVPLTRLTKRKKGLDTAINLEIFEDLSPEETKNKLILGIGHLVQMTEHNADQLLKANEKIADLQKIAVQKDGWYKQQEEALKKELEDAKAQALDEKNALIEEAKESATNSVYEAMFNMAKDAAAAGCLLPSWDVATWAEVLGKPESEMPVLRIADCADGEGQGEATVDVGNEGGMNA